MCRIGQILLFFVALLLLPVLFVRPAAAADAVVGTGTPASCTEAAFDAALATVQAANEGAITFNCGAEATIIFTGQKTITSFVIINGADAITLSGSNKTRLFHVVSPGTLQLEQITITNGFAANGYGGAILAENATYLYVIKSTIQNSRASGSSSSAGGAILAYKAPVTVEGSIIQGNESGYGAINTVGPLVIRDSTMRNNSAGIGGALSVGGSTQITNSQFIGNHSDGGSGGAIFTTASATLEIVGSIFSENDAYTGGALHNIGLAVVTGSQITANTAVGGGGIINLGKLFVTDSTLSGNHSKYNGGALANEYGGDAVLERVAIFDNEAKHIGGGIISRGALTLANSTISRNSAQEGAALWNTGAASIFFSTLSSRSLEYNTLTNFDNKDNTFLSLNNTIIDGSLNPCLGRPADNSSFSLFSTPYADSDAYCLWRKGEGNLTGPTMLGQLGDHGGPTLTHMLLPGSPAIDAGQCGGLTTDQRGVARPQGAACDIGAVERHADDGLHSLYLPLLIK